MYILMSHRIGEPFDCPYEICSDSICSGSSYFFGNMTVGILSRLMSVNSFESAICVCVHNFIRLQVVILVSFFLSQIQDIQIVNV